MSLLTYALHTSRKVMKKTKTQKDMLRRSGPGKKVRGDGLDERRKSRWWKKTVGKGG